MKVMISQPMRGLDRETIINNRKEAVEKLQNAGYEVIDSIVDISQEQSEEIKHLPVYYLGKSLQHMSQCNVIYFCKGWEDARGCIIEHDVAITYGIPVIYE